MAINSELQAGYILEGKYRLIDLLGQGGFSAVFRAEQLGMGRTVAIKVMFPPSHHQTGKKSEEEMLSELVGRFQQEAKVISRLRHPANITVYDHGQTAGGVFFMVLEHVDGAALNVLSEQFPYDAARVVNILRQALEALREAHALGVVHRDIKPHNIMTYDHLGERDLVKVLDFGIARVFESEDVTEMNLTQAGMIIGTPRYMAPELIQNGAIGPPADIYSLGLVAYEMLTGHWAIAGSTSVELIARQISATPIFLPEELEVPSGLRYVINKMIAKSLDERFATADEALEALKRWDEKGFGVPSKGKASGKSAGKGRWLMTALGALVLGVGIVALLLAGSGEEPEPVLDSAVELPGSQVSIVEELPLEEVSAQEGVAAAIEGDLLEEEFFVPDEDLVEDDVLPAVEPAPEESPMKELPPVVEPRTNANLRPSSPPVVKGPAAPSESAAPIKVEEPDPVVSQEQGTVIEERDDGSRKVIRRKVSGPLF